MNYEKKELENRSKKYDFVAKAERRKENKIKSQLNKFGIIYTKVKIRTNGFGR